MRCRGEHHESALAGRSRVLERNEAEHRVPDDVCRERVHDHAKQLGAADPLAARDADDGVVTGGLEVTCFPAIHACESDPRTYRQPPEAGTLAGIPCPGRPPETPGA
jgi:hypothetical protein